MEEKSPSSTNQPASRVSQTPASPARATDDCSSIEDDLNKGEITKDQVEKRKTRFIVPALLSHCYKFVAKSLWPPRNPMYMDKFDFTDEGRVLTKLVFVGDMHVGKSSFLM